MRATPPQNIQRILAVTAGGLGDAILFSPVLKAIRSCYQNASIEILFGNGLAEAVFSQSPEIEHFTVFNGNRSLTVKKLLSLLQFAAGSRGNGGFDLGVFATGLDSKFVVFLKVAVGIRSVCCAPEPPDYDTDLACNVALARVFDPDASEEDAFIPIDANSEKRALEVLTKHGVSIKRHRIGAFYPSSDIKHRPRWGIAKLVDVGRRLKRENLLDKILVLGAKEEGKDWEVNDSSVQDANLAGKLSILETAAVLRQCSVFVGSDGGLVHVAGAVGVPVVQVLTNAPDSYRAPGKQTRVIQSRLDCCRGVFPKRPRSCTIAKCAEDISADEVYTACVEAMSG
jgi:heptosyltransferase-2